MMNLIQPFQKVFRRPIAILRFLLLATSIFSTLILIPVLTIPGNDFFFQIRILDPIILALFISLSTLNALLIEFQLYIRREVKGRQGAAEKAGFLSIILSSLSATIVCAACYSSVLALLGLGISAVLLKYRMVVGGIALFLSLVALYYAGKRINNHCEVCKVRY
ncbi:MAG: hypothetical protein O3B64_03470 [bacterium]|nr:hypothetical protein [bacterium]MDA1024759.1 hypothetical protein [bacterium]